MRKGLNYYMDRLLATIEILSFKLETCRLRRILMSWLNGNGKMPDNTRDLLEIRRIYQDKTTMKIFHERDSLNDVYHSVGEKDEFGNPKKRTH